MHRVASYVRLTVEDMHCLCVMQHTKQHVTAMLTLLAQHNPVDKSQVPSLFCRHERGTSWCLTATCISPASAALPAPSAATAAAAAACSASPSSLQKSPFWPTCAMSWQQTLTAGGGGREQPCRTQHAIVLRGKCSSMQCQCSGCRFNATPGIMTGSPTANWHQPPELLFNHLFMMCRLSCKAHRG
jgi:hypothetical protein